MGSWGQYRLHPRKLGVFDLHPRSFTQRYVGALDSAWPKARTVQGCGITAFWPVELLLGPVELPVGPVEVPTQKEGPVGTGTPHCLLGTPPGSRSVSPVGARQAARAGRAGGGRHIPPHVPTGPGGHRQLLSPPQGPPPLPQSNPGRVAGWLGAGTGGASIWPWARHSPLPMSSLPSLSSRRDLGPSSETRDLSPFLSPLH